MGSHGLWSSSGERRAVRAASADPGNRGGCGAGRARLPSSSRRRRGDSAPREIRKEISIQGLRGRQRNCKMEGCRESDTRCLKIEREIARMCEASSLTHGLTGAVTRALT